MPDVAAIESEYEASIEHLDEAVRRFAEARYAKEGVMREAMRDHHLQSHPEVPLPDDYMGMPSLVVSGWYLGTLETYLDEEGDPDCVEGFFSKSLLAPTLAGMLAHAAVGE